jgi:hypothetical protein
VEALIKGEYAFKRGGAVAACWRGRMRVLCKESRGKEEIHCERNGEE